MTNITPSPLHEIRSPLSAAQVGIQLLIEELSAGEISNEQAIELLNKVNKKIAETSENLEKFRDRLL